jgi:tetratricopeptide (TPR) repeat protein
VGARIAIPLLVAAVLTVGLAGVAGAAGEPRPAPAWASAHAAVEAALAADDLETAGARIPDLAAATSLLDPAGDDAQHGARTIAAWKSRAEERDGPLAVDRVLAESVAAIDAVGGGEHPLAFVLLKTRIDMAVERSALDVATELARERAERASRVLGDEHRVTLAARNDYARILLDDDDERKARVIVKDTLRTAEKALDPEDPDLAPILVTQAHLLSSRRSAREAIPAMSRALALYAKQDPTGPRTIEVFLETAALQISAGDHHGAQVRLQSLLSLLEKAEQTGTAGYAFTLNELSRAQLGAGDLAGAQRSAERALAIAEALPEAERAHAVRPLRQLGEIHRIAGRHDEARARLEQALAIAKDHLEPSSAELVTLRVDLAQVELQRGKYVAAEGLLFGARRLANEHHGQDSLLTGSVLNALAHHYAKRGNWRQAEALADESRGIIMRRKSTRSAAWAAALDTQALILAGQGKLDEAIRLEESALRTLEALDIADVPQNIEQLKNFHAILVQGQKTERAREIEGRIAAITGTRTVAAASSDGGLPAAENERFNFRFRPPGAGWAPSDPTRVSRDAVLSYIRQDPPTLFGLIPKAIPTSVSVSSRDLIDLHAKQVARTTPGGAVAPIESVSVGTLRGHRIQTDAQMGPELFRYVAWITVQKGVAYQLSVWAPADRTTKAQARSYAEQTFAGFSLLK